MSCLIKSLLAVATVLSPISAVVFAEVPKVENPSELASLNESLAKWKKLKGEQGESYEYVVWYSSFSGIGYKTTITFRDGKAVERKYEESVPPDREDYKAQAWTEGADAIGTHPAGAPAKTIDQLYAEAAEILRTRSPARNHIYLGFHADGLLRYCKFAEKNCQDDCSFGVSIDKLRFLTP